MRDARFEAPYAQTSIRTTPMSCDATAVVQQLPETCALFERIGFTDDCRKEVDRYLAANDLCRRLEGYWHVGSRLESLQRHDKIKRDHARTNYVEGFDFMAISTLREDCITVADILGMPPIRKINEGLDAELYHMDPPGGRYVRIPYRRLQALNLEAHFEKYDVVMNTLWRQLLLDPWGFPPCPVELDKDGKDAVRRLRARIDGWEKKKVERESAPYDEFDWDDNHIFDRVLMKQCMTERKVTYKKVSEF